MSKKILIIDDEPEIGEIIKERLEIHQYQVLTATDGQNGINKALKEKPDLIFLDIMMPDVSGGDVAKELNKNKETCHIPVIFLTAALTKTEERENKSINVDGKQVPVIAKPFEVQELLDCIDRYCN